jgi:acetyl-CoA acyltransferase
MDVVDLASGPTAALINRMNLDGREIDSSIFGVVVPVLAAPNLGREVVLRLGLPGTIEGCTVNLACASSNRAITAAAESILTGQASVVLVGGAESVSTVPILFSKNASRRFIELSKARSLGQKASIVG